MGLENSEHIQNIVVDPRNSNVVYVTAIGPLWSSGGDRGLYKTTDGGQTWKAVLTISADTGVTDMVMDPKKPDVLYAAAYQRRRQVGQLIGGGPESGVYKTTNGGQTWTKLTKGLPTVDMGRIGPGDQLEESEHRLRARHRAARTGRLLPIGRCRARRGRGSAGMVSAGRGGRRRSAGRAAAPACGPLGGAASTRPPHHPARRTPAAAPAAPAAASPQPAAGRRPWRRQRRLLPRRRSRLLQRDLRRRPRSRDDLVAADEL